MAKELFWPGEGDGDALSLARKRAIIVFCLAGGGLGFLSSVRGYLAGELLPGTANFHLSIFGPLIILLAPLLIRLRFDPEKIITAILAYSYVLIAAISFSDGGILNHSQFFLVAWAAIVALLYGWKGAFTGGVLTLASFATLLFLNRYVTPSAMGLLESEALLREWLVTGLAFCLLLVVSSAAVFQTSMHRAARRLNEATQAAQSAERAKSEFLANMSHEIRTPMNGVMGMAELLAQTGLDDKQKMFTDVIVRSGSSLLTIINDILDFSKIDAGRMELDPAPFRLRETVDDVAGLVYPRVSEKDLELVVRISPEAPEMMIGDAGRFRQVLANLVGNAVKFTESGHILIDIEPVGHWRPGKSATLRVAVEDTGCGIPADKQHLLFKKFSQVDGSATRKHEGTGLGLAISAALVELMGGTIGVESSENAGSRFWFEVKMPVVPDEAGAAAKPAPASGARMLVVDDKAINRAVLAEQLAAWGFDVATTEDGHAALQILNAAQGAGIQVDCVLLDQEMPAMPGSELVGLLRWEAAIATTPVVMLSTSAELPDGRSFASLDIQGHLLKPISSARLFQAIGDALGTSQKAASVDATHHEQAEMPASEAPAAHQYPAGEAEQCDILVCEDNETNRLVFSQILDIAGLEYAMAADGREGIEKFRTLRPRLIVMDVSLPGMNGLEATAKIRSLTEEGGADVPIIGVTAHALHGDREMCLEAGMSDYLSKPVSPQVLLRKIRKWMDKQDGSRVMRA